MEAIQSRTANVSVIDEAFDIPQLDRTRRIWLYKPAGYDDTDKHYPVVYMHDGQNLFDQATAFGEAWGIDEALNSMLADCIIVGIDNGEELRLREYNFHDHEDHGPGEGRSYIAFIAYTLKPFIDATFRTRPEREHTHLAGSSMGGLISLYGALHYADTFGGAGVFSPSLWIAPDAAAELKEIAEAQAAHPQRFYFYGGAREGGDMLLHLNNMAGLLRQYGHYEVAVTIDPEGDHSEYRWRNVFPHYYAWLAQGMK